MKPDLQRQNLHRELDTILNSRPDAELDRDSIGYPADLTRGNICSSTTTSVEAAALRYLTESDDSQQASIHWLFQLRQLERLIHELVREATRYWPTPPTRGTVIAGVTIGRDPDPETCQWCKLPAPGGHEDPIRIIQGQRFHLRGLTTNGISRPACYYAWWRSQRNQDPIGTIR